MTITRIIALAVLWAAAGTLASTTGYAQAPPAKSAEELRKELAKELADAKDKAKTVVEQEVNVRALEIEADQAESIASAKRGKAKSERAKTTAALAEARALIAKKTAELAELDRRLEAVKDVKQPLPTKVTVVTKVQVAAAEKAVVEKKKELPKLTEAVADEQKKVDAALALWQSFWGVWFATQTPENLAKIDPAKKDYEKTLPPLVTATHSVVVNEAETEGLTLVAKDRAKRLPTPKVAKAKPMPKTPIPVKPLIDESKTETYIRTFDGTGSSTVEPLPGGFTEVTRYRPTYINTGCGLVRTTDSAERWGYVVRGAGKVWYRFYSNPVTRGGKSYIGWMNESDHDTSTTCYTPQAAPTYEVTYVSYGGYTPQPQQQVRCRLFARR